MTKAARTRTQAASAARRLTPPRWVLAAGVAALVAIAGLVVWSTGRGGQDTATPASIDHVHGLGVNPADGNLYAAAHNGVFQLPADGPARRVGDGQQDTMGFTVAGSNHFLASGHPAPGQDAPRHLGLIESTDGGLTWKTLSLSGAADFHALRYRHDTVYGYNSTNGQLMVSRDKATWENRSNVELGDFAVSPANADMLLATTQNGVVRSTDGGRTWAAAGAPPVMLLDWQSDDRLWGMSATGEVMRSGDGGTTWTTAGRVAGTPTAFAAQGDDLFVSVHEQGILRSSDTGTTWTQIHP